MTSTEIKNLPASVRARLLNLAKERREDFTGILTRYALERFMYRLATSEHAERFVLKGGLMLQLWGGQLSRATKDIDMLGRSTGTVARPRAAISSARREGSTSTSRSSIAPSSPSRAIARSTRWQNGQLG